MNENHNDYNYSKKEALYKRMFKFAKDCRALVKRLPKISANFEDSKQLIRSSGSVGANYIEAWDAISKKMNYIG
jgi:four helix bundle protein